MERLISLFNALTVNEAFDLATRVIREEAKFFLWDLTDEEVEQRAGALLRNAKRAAEQWPDEQKELENLREYKQMREMYG